MWRKRPIPKPTASGKPVVQMTIMASGHPQLDSAFWPAAEGRLLMPSRPETTGAWIFENSEGESTDKKGNKMKTENQHC